MDVLARLSPPDNVPRLLPSWTFGLWLSTSFLTSYDEKTVSGFLEGMQTRKCPVRVFHLDCFWMKQYEWCDLHDIHCAYTSLTSYSACFADRCSFTFDPDNFPDPKAYLSEIKQKYGVKICVWSEFLVNVSFISPLKHLRLAVNPYISQLSPIFQEAVKGGYLIKRKDGTPWQYVA